MMEIYTPKEWNTFFGGSPILIIADDGYIYDAKEYNNLMPRPCGFIDMQQGEIYGADYSSISRRPIGYIREKNGIKEIYQKRPEASLGAVPFLYIVGDAIYSREEYYKFFGGSPSAYVDNKSKNTKTVKEEQSVKSTPQPKTQRKAQRSNSGRTASTGSDSDFVANVKIAFLMFVFAIVCGVVSAFVEAVKDPDTYKFIAVMIPIMLFSAKIGFGIRSMREGGSFSDGFKVSIFSRMKAKLFGSKTNGKSKSFISKPQTQTSNKGNAQSAKYQHKCLKCGRTFNDDVKENKYCDACRAGILRAKQRTAANRASTQQEAKSTNVTAAYQPPQATTNPQTAQPTQCTHKCLKCGKTFSDYTANTQYCNFCRVQMLREKQRNTANPVSTPQVVKSTNVAAAYQAPQTAANTKTTQPTQYTHKCLRCGKTFSDYTANTRFCDSCRVQVLREKHSNAANRVSSPQAAKPNNVTAAYQSPQVQQEQKKIVACPVCGTKNKVPAGKGRISVTCRNQECRSRFIVES